METATCSRAEGRRDDGPTGGGGGGGGGRDRFAALLRYTGTMAPGIPSPSIRPLPRMREAGRVTGPGRGATGEEEAF